MPQTDTGERVTDVLDLAFRDGRANAARVDHRPSRQPTALEHA
jgi:hypothetical protein